MVNISPNGKTLKRSVGQRNIWNPVPNKAVSFQKTTKRYNGKTPNFVREHTKNTNRFFYNYTSNHYKNMVNARKSIKNPSRPSNPNVRLPLHLSRVLAEIEQSSNSYEDMKKAVQAHPALDEAGKKKLQSRLRYLFGNNAQVNFS